MCSSLSELSYETTSFNIIMVKAIICDMDGTLCESRQEISYDMGDIITKIGNNYLFAIITGGKWDRIKTQVLPFVGDTEKEGVFSLWNGHKPT